MNAKVNELCKTVEIAFGKMRVLSCIAPLHTCSERQMTSKHSKGKVVTVLNYHAIKSHSLLI